MLQRPMAQQGGDGFEAHAAVDGLGGQRVAELVWRDVADAGCGGDLGDRAVHSRGGIRRPRSMNSRSSADRPAASSQPVVEERLELGVQRDVAVVVELAERDPQPVGGADLHDGIDGEVEELTLAQTGAGQELDGEADKWVRVSASGDQQLGGRRIIEESGQRLVLDGKVTGESGTRAGASS